MGLLQNGDEIMIGYKYYTTSFQTPDAIQLAMVSITLLGSRVKWCDTYTG